MPELVKLRIRGDVERVRLEENDRLTVTMASIVTREEAAAIAQSVAQAFGIDVRRVIIIEPGMSIGSVVDGASLAPWAVESTPGMLTEDQITALSADTAALTMERAHELLELPG